MVEEDSTIKEVAEWFSCFTCFRNNHLNPNCPYKDQIDLNVCTKCRVGDHSLEDFPIILETIMNKKNVNHLSRVPKNEVLNTKKLQLITRQASKIG